MVSGSNHDETYTTSRLIIASDVEVYIDDARVTMVKTVENEAQIDQRQFLEGIESVFTGL